MFTVDANYQIQQPTSQFFASQLLTQDWVAARERRAPRLPRDSDIRDAAGHVLVTAYALHRPDGQWSVMLVNKDQANPHAVPIAFRDEASPRDRFFAGPVSVTTFGSAQYQWHPEVKGGWADPDGPPLRASIAATADTVFVLPEASIERRAGPAHHPVASALRAQGCWQSFTERSTSSPEAGPFGTARGGGCRSA